MSKPTEEPAPAPKGKLVSLAHRDLHAMAIIGDILEQLDEARRKRVLAWVIETYMPEQPAKA